MTLPILALAAALALWLVATRRRPPTMRDRQRAVDRALRDLEERTR